MNKIIPYGRQCITQEDIKAVTDVLQSDYLTQGPKISEFEESFANYVGSKFAVAVSNGTAALHLAALALGVDKDSYVITTPITFAASANAIEYCRGQVLFADIDPNTYVIDLNKVEDLLKGNDRIVGIVPVDFTGYPVDVQSLNNLCEKYGCWILEDACHAPGGARIYDENVRQQVGNGSFSDLAIFSFHPVKHIAAGEGGMVTTGNEKLYQELLRLRTHGITRDPNIMHENHGGWYYEMIELGYNYRLTDFQAALGLSQLQRAESGIKRRREIAANYDRAFEPLGIVVQQRSVNIEHAFHLYVIETDFREELYYYMRDRNIYTQVHYVPVHLMPYYREKGWKEGDFPDAEKYYQRCLSLPMYPTLAPEDQQYVIEVIQSFYKNR